MTVTSSHPKQRGSDQWLAGATLFVTAFLLFTPTVHSFGVLARPGGREPLTHRGRSLEKNTYQRVLRESDSIRRLSKNRLPSSVAVLSGGTETEQRRSGKSPVLVTAVTLMTGCITAAVTGVLPGYLFEGGGVDGSLLLRDVGATVFTGVLGYAFVQVNTWAVSTGQMEPRDARKVIHTLSAPLFMIFWPLFSTSASARIFAAIVPVLNGVRLFLAGSSNQDETALATAVSRSGDAKEAVGGPFIYVCMLAASILLFWRDSPIGIVAMSSLAAGDGMADIVGRRYGANNKWPGTNKSVAGTAAFWLSSAVTATGLLAWMQYTGCLTLPFGMTEVAVTVAGITLVSALLEVAPWFGDDNYSVTLSAAVLSVLFLHS
jgi:phytol kinase